MLPFQPPAQVQPPSAPVPFMEAVERVLDDYDRGQGAGPLAEPLVAPGDRASLRWLLAAATEALPANPFPQGSASWTEAERLRALLQAPPGQWTGGLAKLTLLEPGTQLALWRRGKALAKAGLAPAPRRAWEDALLAAPLVTLVGNYALRHALSFALAEGDLDRFGVLKARHAELGTDLFFGFQRLFSLLGGPAPRLGLWRLPGLVESTLPLGSLGLRRLWIAPLEDGGLPAIPEGTAWLIPTFKPSDDPRDPVPPTATFLAGRAALRLEEARRTAWLIPAPDDLAELGLTVFPVLIELDGLGLVQRIRMGDAAPGRP
jgi:hypothetical protein